MSLRLLIVAGLLNTLLFLPSASASLLLDINGGQPYYSASGAFTFGFEFRTAFPITVEGLGLWDFGEKELAFNHQVGLWSADTQTLLAQTTVTKASTPVPSVSPDGQWLFNPTSPLVLPPGDYVLGAAFTFETAQNGNALQEGGETPMDLFLGPGITFVEPRDSARGPFAYPARPEPDVKIGTFGPNLQLTVTPEPATIALLSLAGLSLLGYRQTRSQRLR